MLPAAGNMHQWKSEPFYQPRLNAIVTAGRKAHPGPCIILRNALRFSVVVASILIFLSFLFVQLLPTHQKILSFERSFERVPSSLWKLCRNPVHGSHWRVWRNVILRR
jgi:hypothetical protein